MAVTVSVTVTASVTVSMTVSVTKTMSMTVTVTVTVTVSLHKGSHGIFFFATHPEGIQTKQSLTIGVVVGAQGKTTFR